MTHEKVIDVSISAAWFLPDEKSKAADQLLEQILDGTIVLVEPGLWHYETINLLKSAVKRKRLNDQQAHQALHFLSEMPVTLLDPLTQGLPAILETSLNYDLSACDATYLHLAQSRGIELLTGDAALLKLSPQLAWIKSLEPAN